MVVVVVIGMHHHLFGQVFTLVAKGHNAHPGQNSALVVHALVVLHRLSCVHIAPSITHKLLCIHWDWIRRHHLIQGLLSVNSVRKLLLVAQMNKATHS